MNARRDAFRPGWPVLHALVLATTFVVFAWPLSFGSGLISGVVGTVAGVIIAQVLLRRRFRGAAVVGGAVALGALGALSGHVLTQSTVLAQALGPATTMQVADVPRWGLLAFAGALLLRTLAVRFRPALALEGAAVVAAIASTVAAHRDGMIARPLKISDWFWTHGVDPVVAFLAVGICGALLLANVLAHQRSAGRTAAQLVIVLLLGVVMARHLHGRDALTPPAGGSKAEKDAQERVQAAARERSADGDPSNDSPSLMDDLPKNGSGKNRPVAVVVFHRTADPTNGIFYFRHVAFSQFNGVRLVQSTRPDADVDVRQPMPSSPLQLRQVPPNASGRSAVATDVALLTEHDAAFALADATELFPVPNPDPARFKRAYGVVSQLLTTDYDSLLDRAPGERAWAPELFTHYTERPSDPRYLKLAEEIRSKLRRSFRDSPLALALAVKQHLEETAIYSMQRDYKGAADPTAAFLFSEDRRGYCVHLAHAAAFLLRSLGVPARVGAGYAVPAAQLGQGSALLIKSGNAHAWVEVNLRNVGWVPVEISPDRSDVKPMPFVEQDLQNLLGEMARKQRKPDVTQEAAALDIGALLSRVTSMIPWVLLALLGLAYAFKGWRLLAPRYRRDGDLARITYRAALDRLSSVGLHRGHGETRERFARRVREVSPAFQELTDAHLASALGGRRPPPDLLRRAAARMSLELRSHIPWWRRVLGVLHPFNWLSSK